MTIQPQNHILAHLSQERKNITVSTQNMHGKVHSILFPNNSKFKTIYMFEKSWLATLCWLYIVEYGAAISTLMDTTWGSPSEVTVNKKPILDAYRQHDSIQWTFLRWLKCANGEEMRGKGRGRRKNGGGHRRTALGSVWWSCLSQLWRPICTSLHVIKKLYGIKHTMHIHTNAF